MNLIDRQADVYKGRWNSTKMNRACVKKLIESGPTYGVHPENCPDDIIAFVGYRLKTTFFVPGFDGKNWVHVMVDEERSRQRIAQRLVGYILCEMKSAGIKEIYASIYRDNTASRRLFTKLGFYEVGSKWSVVIYSKNL